MNSSGTQSCTQFHSSNAYPRIRNNGGEGTKSSTSCTVLYSRQYSLVLNLIVVMPIQVSGIMEMKAQNNNTEDITSGLKSFNALIVKAKRQKYSPGYVSFPFPKNICQWRNPAVFICNYSSSVQF